ncbi:unnamed protein product [Schistocephalus solidus]|uniref:Solute carrier family 40 protein n=1 Tax=Schistocephalus solidus TaxID=70667 RepID=A0A183TMX2_SCHSO|nr:unnamed protein product [Schistocephalus solidus]
MLCPGVGDWYQSPPPASVAVVAPVPLSRRDMPALSWRDTTPVKTFKGLSSPSRASFVKLCIHDLNIFRGFSSYTWWLVLTQAISGIFMGFVMKYASNLVRLFIISSAMVVTTLLSVLIFGLVLKLSFVLSALLVCVALVLYHY